MPDIAKELDNLNQRIIAGADSATARTNSNYEQTKIKLDTLMKFKVPVGFKKTN